MSSSDVYRRVGRGGAGNWYSKKDVEEAEKAQASAVRLPSFFLWYGFERILFQMEFFEFKELVVAGN
jgi:hypothetical protein